MLDKVVSYDLMSFGIVSLLVEILIFSLAVVSLINFIRYTNYGIKLYKIQIKKEENNTKDS